MRETAFATVGPRHFSGNHVVLASPMRQEHASLEDLDEDCPSDPLTDVSEILDGCNSLCSQLCPLLEILEGHLVQDMLFASQEPQEVEVRLGPIRDDADRSFPEELLALCGPLPE